MSELSGAAFHAEAQRQKFDMYRVHNPLKEEYVLEYDTSNTNTTWVFPASDTDQFGVGKGNRDVPMYIAERFLNRVTDILLNDEAEKEWNKVKKSYGTRDDIHRAKERHLTGLLRDQKRRDGYATEIILGMVKRHGDVVKPKDSTRKESTEISAIQRLGFNKKIVEQNLDDIIKEVSDDK